MPVVLAGAVDPRKKRGNRHRYKLPAKGGRFSGNCVWFYK